MALKLRLAARITPSLALTPQLQQAIELLQMSNLEVRAFLAEIAEQNPLVDIEPETGAATPIMADAAREATELPAARASTEGLFRGKPESGRQMGGAATDTDRDARAFDVAASPPSLRDHLGGQLRLKRLPRDVAILALLLVDELDDDGYLRTPLFELADRAGVVVELIEKALEAIQSCAPAGLGARTLPECLMLQLLDKNRRDAVTDILLSRLDLIAEGKFSQLERLTGASMKDLDIRLSTIRSLDPKPGLSFLHAPIQTIVPDILVNKAPDGQWAIELNSDTLPSVLVDSRYAATINTTDGKTEIFLSDCRRQINWLSKALDQRARTILKVAGEIILRQSGFLENGVSKLRPMTLKMLAEKLDIHESTVSRATSGKYLLCPRGIYELRFFFTTGLASTDDSGEFSSAAVSDRIRHLILNENSSDTLSDTQIVTILGSEGMAVARRTVAKYRGVMGIPSSVTRRRQKARH